MTDKKNPTILQRKLLYGRFFFLEFYDIFQSTKFREYRQAGLVNRIV